MPENVRTTPHSLLSSGPTLSHFILTSMPPVGTSTLPRPFYLEETGGLRDVKGGLRRRGAEQRACRGRAGCSPSPPAGLRGGTCLLGRCSQHAATLPLDKPLGSKLRWARLECVPVLKLSHPDPHLCLTGARQSPAPPTRRPPGAQSGNMTHPAPGSPPLHPPSAHSPSSPGNLLVYVFFNDLTFSLQMVPPLPAPGNVRRKRSGCFPSATAIVPVTKPKRLRPN